MFKTSTGEFLHHSFIVKGNESCIGNVKEDLGENVVINTYIEDGLTIDKVREIINHSEMISRGGVNVYVLYFNSVSGSRNESQHALLKALEEPKKNTIFILITPNTSKLLDTVHSRCFYLDINNEEESSVDDFISLPIQDRIKYVEAMTKKHKEGKIRKSEIVDLMSACIDKKKDNKDVFRRLVEIHKLINSPSASIKQSLESFAICLD
jgi:DNA polymerase III delta prime subunit